MNNKTITLSHGSGGKASQDLIRNVFIKSFGNPANVMSDSAILKISGQSLAFTTDSFVIDPIFFPGGDIGKLAICGTVNDLAVSGAIPKYISVSFIIEEGFELENLEKIAESIAMQAKIANVKIVAGDTKVVNRGKCDKLFINTSGIGVFEKELDYLSTGEQVEQGDLIIINGTLGDHSVAVLGARNQLGFKTDIVSDCASLNELIQDLISKEIRVKFMRDITRGGLATVLNELSEITNKGIEINEKEIPIKDTVYGICEILGFDPLYLANEGKVMIVIHPDDAEKTLEILKQNSIGVDSKIIGEVVNMHPKMVVGKTNIGGKRIINMLQGEQLPRIC